MSSRSIYLDNAATTAVDPRVIAAEHGWWFPEQKDPTHGIWQSNINVLTNNQPPYDPAMGTYQLRGLLCRVYAVVEGDADGGAPAISRTAHAD